MAVEEQLRDNDSMKQQKDIWNNMDFETSKPALSDTFSTKRLHILVLPKQNKREPSIQAYAYGAILI